MSGPTRTGRELAELVGNLACAPHLYAMRDFLGVLKADGWVLSRGLP